MPMPIDLVLVRHGQSEGNVAVHASKAGDDSHMNHPEFRARHSSWWRLTDLGIEQARLAGEWIRTNLGGDFDRYYSSAYLRAMETAANLELPNARWYVDPNLRERERGKEDLLSASEREMHAQSAAERKNAPLYWRPLNGESIADTCTRVRSLCETLHRETSDGRVIVVCHGEVMEAFRLVLERMTPYAYADWTSSEDAVDRIHNGQVFHYTRRDPATGELANHYLWRRSVATSDLSLCNLDWQPIVRPVFDNGGLMELVNRMPRVIH
jgi:broad specificity phosphatase PhoE